METIYRGEIVLVKSAILSSLCIISPQGPIMLPGSVWTEAAHCHVFFLHRNVEQLNDALASVQKLKGFMKQVNHAVLKYNHSLVNMGSMKLRL